MSASRTPSSITMTRREPTLDIDASLGRDWHGGDPFKTAIFNAFSITFPTGERFFIDAVRAFEEDITDPLLREHMKCFIGQEAQHRREHQNYNQTLCQARGYDLAYMELKQRKRIEWMKANVSRYQWLAATVALEHITALTAHGILTNPAWLEGAEPDMAELWRWHALEETEHKAVTFDVYRAVNGWDKTRQQILNVATYNLLKDVLGHTYYMLKVAGLAHRPGVWWNGMRFLFGRQGIWRPLVGDWKKFKDPNFHPWDHDNLDLVLNWANAST